MSNFNVGVVTISALVNTGDLEQTKKELLERVSSHPTTVEAFISGLDSSEELVTQVESGNYEPGSLSKIFKISTELGEFNLPLKGN